MIMKNEKFDLPDLKEIPNGEKVKGTFSETEMQNRLDSLRTVMSDIGIDSVLFTSIHNINYYSDFLYCSFGRPYGLVVTKDRATTISANIDAGQPYRRTYGENLVYTDWRRDNYIKAVIELIGDSKKIGTEFDHMNLSLFQKLKDQLTESEVIDISQKCMELRMVKSDEEIALIRQGARIADVGGSACVEAVSEGVPEYQVALHSTQAMVNEIAATFPHLELMDTWTWFQSGINTDGAHNPVTSRQITKGDILSLNCFPMISGSVSYTHLTLPTIYSV